MGLTTTEEHVTSITMDPTAFSHLSRFNAAPFDATLLLAGVYLGSLGRADRLAVPATAPILSLFALPMNPEALREFYENCILLTL